MTEWSSWRAYFDSLPAPRPSGEPVAIDPRACAAEQKSSAGGVPRRVSAAHEERPLHLNIWRRVIGCSEHPGRQGLAYSVFSGPNVRDTGCLSICTGRRRAAGTSSSRSSRSSGSSSRLAPEERLRAKDHLKAPDAEPGINLQPHVDGAAGILRHASLDGLIEASRSRPITSGHRTKILRSSRSPHRGNLDGFKIAREDLAC